MAPRLTIVIPTVNRAELLGRAIESALAQTSPEVEIIVSDNGSTDETQMVISRYAARGLRTFRHPSTIDVSRHSEFLIKQIQTEFCVALSDDDFLEPEFAAEALALFDRHPELSFVYTGCTVHYEDSEVPALVGPSVEPGAAFLAAHYGDSREVSWCACVTRVRDLRESQQPPEGFVLGDMFFWTQLAFRGPIGCVPRILSHYILLRAKNNNISHGTSPVVWARESRLLADYVIQRSCEAGASAEYVARLKVASRRHVARSVANQFVWVRIRGASPMKSLRHSLECLPYLLRNPTAYSRLIAALLLPRAILRRLLLNSAARMADARRAKQASQS